MELRLSAIVAPLAMIVVACNAAEVSSGQTMQGVNVAVQPSSAMVAPSSTATFAAAVTGTLNLAVRWTIQESDGGTIDQSGNYAAPSATGIYHVVAQSLADSTKTASATVNVAVTPDCASAAEPTSNVVYVCDCKSGFQTGCTAGLDTNTGTKAKPKQSWAAAMAAFNALPAGGTVALCSGGSWISDGPGYWANTRCTASSPCTIREYKPDWGGTNRPLIQHSSGATTTLLYFGNVHGQSGYRVWNLAMKGVGVSAGVAMWDQLTDVDLCNLDISGFNLGVYPAGGPSGGPGQGYIQQRVTLRNSYIHENGNVGTQGGWGGGLGWLGSCPDCVIDNNTFENNGATPSGFAHQIYISGPPSGFATTATSVTGMKVTNNRIWTHDTACGGVRFVVHQGVDGLVVENNLWQATNITDQLGGCWAFSISPGNYRCPVQWSNLVFRRNRVMGSHGNTPLSVTGTTNALFEDNVIQESNAGAVVFQIPGLPQGACPAGGGSGNYPANTGTIIRNNTIHLPNGGTGIRFGINEGSGHVVANNAVLSGSATYSCVTTSAPMAYNGSNWCGTTSPFVDAASGNYTPASGGPLVGTANTNSSYLSPYAMFTQTWSASDALRSRSSSDIGAMSR